MAHATTPPPINSTHQLHSSLPSSAVSPSILRLLPLLPETVPSQRLNAQPNQRPVVRCRATTRAVRQSSTRIGQRSGRGSNGLLGSDRKGDQDEQQEDEGRQGKGGRLYFNFTGFPFPLSPFLKRLTLRSEIERGSIWTFEQEQGLGLSSVTTNTRMTVIKLQTGGLWVHAPIAPTQECLALLRELDAPVEHIVLPTFAYEHKIFVGPFARRFPKAKVWTAPLQWSWPLNLPPQLFGIFPSASLLSPSDSSAPPWTQEIDFKVLQASVGIGPYVEVAFFHKASRTLLLTDAVILVPPSSPPVISSSALLGAAENGLAVQVLSAGQDIPKTPVEDTLQFRALGWQRMVLQILYFGPANLLDPSDSFDKVVGKLTVSPVVKTLVFDKIPVEVLTWIDSICQDWSFVRIIPCHFSAPIRASPSDLRSLFFGLLKDAAGDKAPSYTGEEGKTGGGGILGFLRKALPLPSKAPQEFPEEDLRTLRSLDNALVSLGAAKKTGT